LLQNSQSPRQIGSGPVAVSKALTWSRRRQLWKLDRGKKRNEDASLLRGTSQLSASASPRRNRHRGKKKFVNASHLWVFLSVH